MAASCTPEVVRNGEEIVEKRLILGSVFLHFLEFSGTFVSVTAREVFIDHEL